MAVKVKYFSDRDPQTMFDNKKEADEYDRKLEAIEYLSDVLTDAGAEVEVKFDDDRAYALAEALLERHRDELAAVAGGKKLKPRVKDDSEKVKPFNKGDQEVA